MRASQLLKRGLAYYWRTNLAVVLGVAAAVAVLSGALLVGDSVRTSLRNLVLQRLGQTSFLIASSGFFREDLARDLENDPQFAANGFSGACPLISLEATVTHEPSKRVASRVNVYGVDERFWKFQQQSGSAPQNRNTLLSEALARELGAVAGESVLLRVATPSAIPLESLHSKKDEVGQTLRLTVSKLADGGSLGEFSLQPQQSGVRALFVSLDVLQRELSQPDKVNLLLISEKPANSTPGARTESLGKILRERVALADLGIRVRPIPLDESVVIALEHESKLIEEPLARVAEEIGADLSLQQTKVFSYLANSLTSGDRSIPYSLVTAVGDDTFAQLSQAAKPGDASVPPIVLNEWAAEDLAVKQGDVVVMEYYLWQEAGRIETKTARFRVAGVVPIRGLAADRNLVPEYPGITGSENLADWDPPFPVDLKRIREKDEDYWHQYNTTPKAFIPLTTGQSLWQTRFGKITSVRYWPPGGSADETLRNVEARLKRRVNPALMGLNVIPVRSQGLEASRGATDFGEYFVYFSFFVVISALLLTTLFFKLGVEQRTREIGLLRAIGFGPGKIRKLFLVEGLTLAIIGSLLGLAGALAYGQLMMLGLRTWWVDAVGTTALKLQVSPQSLMIGAFGGIIAALICVALTLRSLGKSSTRSLLAGIVSTSTNVKTSGSSQRRITSLLLAVLLTFIGLALLIAAAARLIGQVGGFFGGGTLLLVAFLLYQSSWLRRRERKSITGSGWWPVAKLGFRNTSYRPSRSILSVALIASAVFIIVAVDSFRHRGATSTQERKSSTGGFPLFAESLLPVVNDPNSAEGREALNLTTDESDSALKDVSLSRFRVQPGDDASCLNLYQPKNPKILAPTGDFVNSNRFNFQNSLASSSEEVTNPWLLLNRGFADGAVPVITDANSLTYVLHLKVGDDFVLQHGDQPVRLRIVAALADSLFQSELLMSEQNFLRLFPDQQGYRFFLIDVPNTERSADVAAVLEDRLADFGFDVQPTIERMATFHRVENTYLSTFQMLGGLGLILGTIGLSAILLRNVLERRRELALMRAVGYNARHFTLMIISENALLLFAGVITGAICAMLAITPVFLTRQTQFLNVSLGFLLLAVLVSGLIASLIATWATLRAPLLKALRAE